MTTTDQTIEKCCNVLQYLGAGSAVALGFLDSHGAGLGALVAIIAFFINWYYKHKAFKILKDKYKNEETEILG